ncbi:MAG: TspO/MBR family protein [Pseudomonadota bacterium]
MAVALAVAFVVSGLGGALTDVGEWYRDLEKSALNPPDFVFGLVWTIIYGLCVAAAVIGWRRIEGISDRGRLLALFAVNAIFNLAWSALFFTVKRPDWALAEVFVLALSVAALIVFFRPRAPLSAALLVPYLLWVSFAAFLNYEVVRLNAPFG